ncbi:putative mucin-4 [Sesbania bispinosa]|nr:putative mucin-4 [Sesbania bispinosa]
MIAGFAPRPVALYVSLLHRHTQLLLPSQHCRDARQKPRTNPPFSHRPSLLEIRLHPISVLTSLFIEPGSVH